MDLKTKIEQDFLEAYKAHKDDLVSVLRMLKSSFKNQEIALGHSLSDEEAIRVIKKEAKQREDSASEFAKGGRQELADKEKSELAILNTYLPEQMNIAELKTIVEATIVDLGATSMADMGKVMGAVNAKVAGRADGGTISGIVKEILNQ